MRYEDETEEYDVFEELEKERCPLSDSDLFRLAQCAKPTRMGIADKGSPQAYYQLSVLGYTKAVDGGYMVTPDGFTLLTRWTNKLRTI